MPPGGLIDATMACRCGGSAQSVSAAPTHGTTQRKVLCNAPTRTDFCQNAEVRFFFSKTPPYSTIYIYIYAHPTPLNFETRVFLFLIVYYKNNTRRAPTVCVV
jgi:hypothetical protein